MRVSLRALARPLAALFVATLAACSGKPELVAITLTPTDASVAAGATQAFAANGRYTDGSTLDLTSAVTWSSSDTTVATISTAAGAKGVATGVRVGTTTISAKLDKVTSKSTLTVTSAAVSSLALTPANSSIAVGTGEQLTATATLTDGTTQDVSSTVAWSTSAPGATVDANGFVQVTEIGTFQITATLGEITATASVRATNAQLQSIAIAPASPSLPLGVSQQLTATGTFSDSTTQDLTSIVTWASSAASVAAFQGSANGKVTALALGTATITATTMGVTGQTTLTVTEAVLASVAISPAAPTVAIGNSLQLTATGTNTDQTSADLSNDVVWSSSNPTVADFSDATRGLVLGLSAGSTTLTATSGTIQGTVTITVTSAVLSTLTISSPAASFAKGTTLHVSALGTLTDGSTQDLTSVVTWTSTDEAVATISNTAGTRGIATGVAAGMCTLTARLGDVSSNVLIVTVTDAVLDTVTVSPALANKPVGVPQAFTAEARFTDGSTQDITNDVVWSATPDTQVSFSTTQSGLATGLVAGTATVSATFQNVTGSATFNVSSAALASIAVSPAAATLPLGSTQSFTAQGIFTDDSTADLSSLVDWSSSDATIVSISNAAGLRGRATGVATGTADIKATYMGVTSPVATVTVLDAELATITIAPAFASVPQGLTQSYTATGKFTDDSEADITAQATWAVSDPSVASAGTPDATVILTALVAGGTTTVTATLNGVSGTSSLVTTAPVLASVAITPGDITLVSGVSEDLHLVGTLTDGTTQDLTSVATWTSDDSSVASVVNGTVTARAGTGTATITASAGGFSASVTVTATAPVLTAVTVVPGNVLIALGQTQQLSVSGSFSDGSTAPVAEGVTWNSLDVDIASVSADGLVTGTGEGTVVVGVQVGALSGSAVVNVGPAVLSAISLVPASLTLPSGTTENLTVRGTYSDGTSKDLTSQAVWASSNLSVATVVGGLVKAVAATGTADITATIGAFSASSTITAAAPLQRSVSVFPGNVLLANGTSQQLSARSFYSDGTSVDVTAQAEWTSLDISLVTVSPSGRVTGASPGTTSVTATIGGLTSAAVVNVVTPTLTSISVTPATSTIASGTTLQYAAFGVYTDGSLQNLTSQVNWAASNPSVSISNSAGSNGLASALSPTGGAISISATLSGVTGSAALTVSSAALQSISIAPAAPVLPQGTMQQLTATGLYSDGSNQDLSAQVTWSVSGTAFDFSGSGTGLLEAIVVGSGTVTATLGAVSASVTAQATDATLSALRITPATSTLASGTTAQLSAIATYSDGTTRDVTSVVVWASSASTTAAVSNLAGSFGVVTASVTGSASISATLGAATATASISVSSAVLTGVSLSPAVATVAKGTTFSFTATGSYSDGTVQDLTSQATWTSSDAAIAAVSNAAGSQGLASGLAAGTVQVSASFGGTSGSSTLTVTSATLESISVSPALASIAVGTSLRFAATGTYSDGSTQDISSSVTWSSNDATVASISNAAFNHGVSSAFSVGSVVLTATLNGVSGASALSVTDATLDSIDIAPEGGALANGTSLQFLATGNYSDGTSQDLTTQASWTSSALALSFSAGTPGLAHGDAAGSVQVTATLNGVSASVSVTVTNAALNSIDILPADSSLASGTTLSLSATGHYSDGTAQDLSSLVSWTSSNSTVASVSNAAGTRGLAYGLSTGTVTITATLSGVSASTSLTVSAAVLSSITVAPAVANISSGLTQSFTAVGRFTDGTTQDVTSGATWTVANGSVVGLASAGSSPMVATGLMQGTTTLSASLNGVTGTASVTVITPTLQSITVSPTTASLAVGTSQLFAASGSYSDGSTQDITSLVTWVSSAETVATVSNTVGTRGLALAVGAGAADITATLGGQSATATVNVTNATLTGISIAPSSLALPKGTAQSLTVTGTYTNGSTQNLTTQVTWSSSDESFASVSTAGSVQGLAVGTATITAAFGGFSSSITATVFPPVLTSLSIDPPLATIANGTKAHFVATGIFTDGSVQDVTSSITWASSDETVATISNDASTHGQALGVSAGSTIITASSGTVDATASLSVSSATLTTISLSPTAPVLANGTAVQLSATGLYTDGSSQDITGDVIWTADADAVAFSDTVRGLLLANAVGSATVTASLGGVWASTPARVTDATLTSLSISPAAPTLPLGTSLALTARGFYSDGSSQDLTSLAAWDTSDASVIAVSTTSGTKGQITALAAGSATVTASFGGQSTSISATGTAALLSSISISPSFAAVAKGTVAVFNASGLYSDGTVQDLTGQVIWSSSDPTVLAISNAGGQQGIATAVAQGTVVVTADLGSISGSAPVTVTSATLQSISVEPALSAIANGTSLQFAAIGVYSDGSTQDLTSSVTWTSSDDTVATVSNATMSRGLAHGSGAGAATITASFGGVSASGELDVSSATLQSLSITPTAPVLASGTSLQLSATGLFSDGSSQDLTADVSWTVSGASLAFATTPGLLQALSAGSGTVTAQLGSASATASALVTNATLLSLSISPPDPVLAKGTTFGLAATGTYSDGSSQDLTSLVTWTSDNTRSVTVSNATGSRGIVAAVAIGLANITASINGVTGTTSVTVNGATLSSIAVTPPFVSLAKGTTSGLAAAGIYSDGTSQDLTGLVTWTSSNNTIAAVSNATGSQGVVTAVGSGTATITAGYNGFTAASSVTVSTATLQSIAVTPSVASIANGSTLQFFATGTYSDGTTQDLSSTVAWASANTSVASISNVSASKGVAAAGSAGNTTITATVGGLTGTASLTVTGALLLNITVSPSATIAVGQTYQAFATGFYSDGTSQDLTKTAAWNSSNSSVATVSANVTIGSGGQITGKKAGTVTITASVGNVSGILTVTVTSATLSSIQLSPLSATLAAGAQQQFRAIATYSDGSTQDITKTVTWTSTATTVATVTNSGNTRGLVTAVRSGSATISGTYGGKSGRSVVTVTTATLQSIALSPATTSLAAGSAIQFKATGLYNDHSALDITSQVTWGSSASTIATISNAADTRGLASGLSAGTTAISATLKGISSQVNLSVTSASVVSIAVTPQKPRIAKGTTAALTATALFDDGTTLDVTSNATWTTSDAAVATVSAITGSQGVVSGVAAGTSTISATYGGVSTSTSVTVTNATLSYLTVTPTGVNLPVGYTQQFTATGRFSDGTSQDLTNQVTWSCNKTNVCVPSNDTNRGLVTGIDSGNTQVQAAFRTASAKTNLKVTSASLSSIAVGAASGSSLSVPVGFSGRLVATGTFSDGSTRDISATATWASSDGSIAMPSASGNGVVTALSVGSASITAAVGAITRTVTFTGKGTTLSSIAVTTTSGAASVAVGASISLKATGTFADGSTLLVSDQCAWSSADTTIATVVDGNPATVTGVKASSSGASIRATAGGITGALTVTVQ